MNKRNVTVYITFVVATVVSIIALVFAEERYLEYTVKRGDTQWGIASEYLHDPFLWPKIWIVNPNIKNPDRIYPGQKIRLPNSLLKEEKKVEKSTVVIVTLPQERVAESAKKLLEPFLKDLKIEETEEEPVTEVAEVMKEEGKEAQEESSENEMITAQVEEVIELPSVAPGEEILRLDSPDVYEIPEEPEAAPEKEPEKAPEVEEPVKEEAPVTEKPKEKVVPEEPQPAPVPVQKTKEEVQPPPEKQPQLLPPVLPKFHELKKKKKEKKPVVTPAPEIEKEEIEPEEYVELVPLPEGKDRIAIFPFENLSKTPDALSYVMPFIKKQIEDKGVEIVPQKKLEKFLVKYRIRRTGFVSRDTMRKIRKELGVTKVLTGSVINFLQQANPKVGILARLIDTGTGEIVWADYSTATGEDFVTILGLGRIGSVKELSEKVVERLFEGFNPRQQKQDKNSIRVAVVPFYNTTDYIDAGLIVAYMYIVELFKDPMFDPVELGDLRDLMIRFKIRPNGELRYSEIDALYKKLKIDGIIVGMVDEYSESAYAESAPMVSIFSRLIDAKTKKLLWANFQLLDGDKEIIVLDWRKMRSADKVAYRTITKQIKELEKLSWRERF